MKQGERVVYWYDTPSLTLARCIHNSMSFVIDGHSCACQRKHSIFVSTSQYFLSGGGRPNCRCCRPLLSPPALVTTSLRPHTMPARVAKTASKARSESLIFTPCRSETRAGICLSVKPHSGSSYGARLTSVADPGLQNLLKTCRNLDDTTLDLSIARRGYVEHASNRIRCVPHPKSGSEMPRLGRWNPETRVSGAGRPVRMRIQLNAHPPTTIHPQQTRTQCIHHRLVILRSFCWK